MVQIHDIKQCGEILQIPQTIFNAFLVVSVKCDRPNVTPFTHTLSCEKLDRFPFTHERV